jgi:hypothetical protein
MTAPAHSDRRLRSNGYVASGSRASYRRRRAATVGSRPEPVIAVGFSGFRLAGIHVFIFITVLLDYWATAAAARSVWLSAAALPPAQKRNCLANRSARSTRSRYRLTRGFDESIRTLCEFREWESGYWRPLQINREFASHFSRKPRLRQMMIVLTGRLHRWLLRPQRRHGAAGTVVQTG